MSAEVAAAGCEELMFASASNPLILVAAEVDLLMRCASLEMSGIALTDTPTRF